VEISLSTGQQEVLLTIQDNGCGFVLEAVEKGYGLRTMAERVQRLGGDFSLESRPQQGTKVTAKFPLI
jgi:signal transduction histidine kinase